MLAVVVEQVPSVHFSIDRTGIDDRKGRGTSLHMLSASLKMIGSSIGDTDMDTGCLLLLPLVEERRFFTLATGRGVAVLSYFGCMSCCQ